MKRALVMLGLLVGALTCGCAGILHPPASSTPLREVRYLRTKDTPNLVLGAGCDLAVGVVIRGTSVPAVLGRFGTCAAGAVIQRQTDRGYREGGGLFVVSGAWLIELVRIVTGKP